MTASGKMVVLMYSNSSSLVRISLMGLDRDFFSMAQTPTTTDCRIKVVVTSREKRIFLLLLFVSVEKKG